MVSMMSIRMGRRVNLICFQSYSLILFDFIPFYSYGIILDYLLLSSLPYHTSRFSPNKLTSVKTGYWSSRIKLWVKNCIEEVRGEHQWLII